MYSNISPEVCPAGCSSLYVEVGIPGGALADLSLVTRLQPKVIDELQRLGWVDPADIVCCVAHSLTCAYVHHTPEREAVIAPIMERLQTHNVHPIGRYGLWDYTSMEDSIYSGIAAVEEVA
jgi:protoporphyrinogen oxidase